MAAGMDPFVKYKIDREILHGRVEKLLDRFGESMDFIDKKHIAIFQMGQQPDQIAPFFKRRARGYGQLGLHLRGNNMRQGGFPQSRGAVQQNMIHRLLALPRGGNGDLKGFDDLNLADIINQLFRAQRNHFRSLVNILTDTGDNLMFVRIQGVHGSHFRKM